MVCLITADHRRLPQTTAGHDIGNCVALKLKAARRCTSRSPL